MLNSRLLMLLFGLLLGSCMLHAQSTEPLNLMPLPAKVVHGEGALKIDADFRLAFSGYQEARLEHAGQRFRHQLRLQTGILLLPVSKAAAASATLTVTTDHESKPVQELGEDESYTLDVGPAGAKLHAANPL